MTIEERVAAALHDLDLVGVCFHEADGKGFAGGRRIGARSRQRWSVISPS